MCKAMEEMCKQAVLEYLKGVASRMLATGKFSLEEIADITELSLEEVKKLKAAQGE